MNKMDPLLHFYKLLSFSPKDLQELVVGDKYVGCLLKSGELGVCATLDHKIDPEFSLPNQLDLDNLQHRIIFNAYANARLNYQNDYPGTRDIFDFIPFKSYERIVMVGYFTSLVAKFEAEGIDLSIFDLDESKPGVVSMAQQSELIKKSDALIISSTSIHNGTFNGLLSSIGPKTEVFLLGPSTPLDQHMYSFSGVKKIFGMIFPDKQKEVLRIIADGKGTPSFGKFGRKVYL